MGQHFFPRVANTTGDIEDAAAVYPDHDIVTRHIEGSLTIGDFVSAFAEGADGHGGLPTYLRITINGDTTKIRRLMDDDQTQRYASKVASR